jgi:hypothetical protein
MKVRKAAKNTTCQQKNFKREPKAKTPEGGLEEAITQLVNQRNS